MTRLGAPLIKHTKFYLHLCTFNMPTKPCLLTAFALIPADANDDFGNACTN